MAKKPDRPSTLTESVVARLRSGILTGYYRPGQRLTEFGLAEEMETSRTPVIAALRALTAQGLITYATSSGYWVRELSVEDVIQAYEIRASLEGLACRLAAERSLPADTLASLEECLDMGEALTSGPALRAEDEEAYTQMNVRLHTAILNGCGNPRLNEFVRKTHELPLASNRVVFWKSLEIVRRSHDAHVRIVDAIRNRQGLRAEMLMREHVYEAGDVLRRYWHELVPADPVPEARAAAPEMQE